MEASGFLGKGMQMTVCRLVAPQDGGLSLTPMEGLLRGLRSPKDVLSLEISGLDGVVGYTVRSNNGRSLAGMLQSWFPQVRVDRRDVVLGGWAETEKGASEGSQEDWLRLGGEEYAVVKSLGLTKASYLPLRIFDDDVIRQSGKDPLAGVIGQLASLTRGAQGVGGGDRLGMRLVIKPAEEDWNRPWQSRMQMRRDGDDRVPRGTQSRDEGPSMTSIMVLGGLLGAGGCQLVGV